MLNALKSIRDCEAEVIRLQRRISEEKAWISAARAAIPAEYL